jgi:enoyl-CoA hydratase
MSYQTILLSIEDHICTITINRPDKLNALNKAVFNDLDRAIVEIRINPDIWSAIITGS